MGFWGCLRQNRNRVQLGKAEKSMQALVWQIDLNSYQKGRAPFPFHDYRIQTTSCKRQKVDHKVFLFSSVVAFFSFRFFFFFYFPLIISNITLSPNKAQTKEKSEQILYNPLLFTKRKGPSTLFLTLDCINQRVKIYS